jgi:arylsulfatase
MNAARPNLLFIMTDQQRFDALGANGNRIIQTPNLGALARRSVNVQGFYTQSPVCVPSRCNLFTGRYPHAHRIRENHNLLEAGREIHLFRVLKKAGYRLGYTGKNHLLEREEFANFDFVNDDPHDDPALRDWHQKHRDAQRAQGQPEIWRAGAFHDFPDETTRTWRTALPAVEFLKQQSKDQPFCLCVSFSDPHVPHLAPRRFEKLYPLDKLQLHPWREGELTEKARRFHIKWRAQKSDTADEAGRRHYMAVYYAMISFVDEMIGRILAALEQTGAADNTLIVFTSDHGDFCFEHNMAKKDLVLLESLLHVPCLMSLPGKLEPRVVADTLMEQVDVMPTILDVLGVPVPFGVQGRSLLPYLRGEKRDHRDAVYAEICPPWLYNRFATYEEFEAHHGSWEKTPMNVPGDFNKCIRTRDYRYVWYGTGEEELYDLRRDPHEQHNVAGKPGYASIKTELKLRLLEWNALTEDPLDPLSIRQLQTEYAGWQTGHVSPGTLHGPGWLAERFTPNPREL